MVTSGVSTAASHSFAAVQSKYRYRRLRQAGLRLRQQPGRQQPDDAGCHCGNLQHYAGVTDLGKRKTPDVSCALDQTLFGVLTVQFAVIRTRRGRA